LSHYLLLRLLWLSSTSAVFPYTTLFRSIRFQRKSDELFGRNISLFFQVARRKEMPGAFISSRKGYVVIRLYAVLQQEVYPIRIEDRKSTRLNSIHVKISYAFFCVKKKKA